MKKLMKMMTFAIALIMCIAMAMPAMAHTISVKDTDTHEYKVFQVLTGTLSEEGSKQLGNPAWGEDAIAEPGDVNDFIASITAAGLSEQDIAQLVAAKVNTASEGQGTVKKDQPLEDLETGYYVLVDVTEIEASEDGKIDTKSLHVVRVVNDVNGFDIKYGTTEVDKKITGDTLGNATEDDPNVPEDTDTDNVSIGDTVYFEITATIPANAKLYNYFYFVINDTLDPGLTLNENSIEVFALSGDVTEQLDVDDQYYVRYGDEAKPNTFQVGLDDAKGRPGQTIIVRYSAVLNENATIGEVPNKNTSTVTFSNDPNHDYNGEEYPGFPAEEDLEVTGTTPESKTETYTTGIELQKVDENGNVLTGAEFTITGDSTEIVLVSSETFTEATGGEYYGLKNETYTKDAPVTADYMKEAAPGATKGYVIDPNAEGDGVITINGTTYRPYTEADAGEQVYILVKANADQYDGKRYAKTITYTQKNTKENPPVTATAEVGADGVVRFVGLGAGEYTITETKTPAGYNTIQPVTITIGFTADPAEGAVHWSKTAGSGEFTYNPETGVFETTIVNNKGQELPSTGGMGTTMLYVIGAVLVLGAGVLLVTRRKMSAR